MVQHLTISLIFLSTWCFAQPDFSEVPVSTDSTYGYTATNPLKMKRGNPGKSIGYSYDFLSGLVTPDNRPLKFLQRHTVENPENEESKSKSRDQLLDKYIFVTHEKNDTLTIYVDIYRKADLRIPMGLRYR